MNNFFFNKTVLVTGHTGFKGSWLSAWLTMLGAKVIGLSNNVPTKPAHYELILDNFKKDYRIDIKDSEAVLDTIREVQPHFVFHLAAQSIVISSYENPLNTLNTNIIGTANILDSLREVNQVCTAIIITSDKCYENMEWNFGYRETDNLGGKDPYSGSKASAEMVIRSYVQSFFKKTESNTCLAVGRAGNVVGGGDWAPYRIVPDCVRAWSKNKKPEIRNSFATRPWQHVLEPLSGYIALAYGLSKNNDLNGEAFNFGPPANQNHTVTELVDEITLHWPGSEWVDKSKKYSSLEESELLKLNCDKALHILGWQATLNFKETSEWTAKWYRNYYENGPESASEFTVNQIKEYMELANKRNSFKFW